MRLFIALPLPGRVEDYLGEIIFDLKQHRGKVKWVAHTNIHLTAKFLGDTDESLVESIREAITAVANGFQPINCTIDKIGGFPNLRRPRVIWAGLTGEIDRLAEISSAMEEKAATLGFAKENKKFKPHLTLGRVKDDRSLGQLVPFIESYEVTPIEVLFDRLVLFKSTLTPAGPIYERLHEASIADRFG